MLEDRWFQQRGGAGESYLFWVSEKSLGAPGIAKSAYFALLGGALKILRRAPGL